MFYSNNGASCYHEKISRDTASQLLLRHGNGQDGYYLLRDCSSAPGDYVLSVWNRKQVMHFQVHCISDNKFAIDDGPVFHGLDSLTAHYAINADGLPCKLTGFCPGKFPPLPAVKFGKDTKLHQACNKRSVSSVRQLLQEPSVRNDINARNAQGLTALHIACGNGDDSIVSSLLSAGANTSASDSSGKTPMQVVCHAGHATTLRILITQGHADFHERNTANGWVPLHEVCKNGFLECVKVLLSFHASLNPRTSDGDTPRDLALRFGHHIVLDYLENYPVPAPKTSPAQWLHQNLDRQAAVHVLDMNGLVEGSFLIRNSTKCHGYYVLSHVSEKKVFHFQIKSRADRWFYIDDGPLFETLPHLVDHYMQYADGLPSTINHPVASAENRISKRSPIPLPQSPSNVGTAPLVLPSRPPRPNPSFPRKDIQPVPRPNHTSDELDDSFSRVNRKNPKGPPVPPSRPTIMRNVPLPEIPNPQPVAPQVISSQSQSPNHHQSPHPAPTQPQQSTRPIPTKNTESSQQTFIPKEALELGQELGLGEFGSVLKGVWTNSSGKKIAVALKTLHQDKLQQGEKEFLREARVMSHLDHPCIVRLLGVCLGPPMILVQELVTMGALLDHLIDHQPEISEVDLKLWASQIAYGMTYLEQKRFVHRDLATRNILLSSKDQAKISDFGLSRAVGTGSDYYQAQQGGRWPVKWYAPESINYGTFSQKSDVWSYGVTLWEMFTYGELPYGEMTGAEVIKLLENGQRLEQPEGCPSHTYQIMLRCWHIEPAHRPTFKELHTIFSTDPEYEDARKYQKNLKR